MDIRRPLIIVGIAVVSYLMILAWQRDYGTQHQEASTHASQQVAGADQASGAAAGDNDLPQPGAHAAPDDTATVPENTGGATLAPGQQIQVHTDVLNVRINPQGGDIDWLALPKYPKSVDTPNQPFVLMKHDKSLTYVVQSGLVGPDGTDTSKGRPTWQAAQHTYTLADGKQELNVDLTLDQGNGVQITKRYTFERGSYLVHINYIVHNNGSAPWKAALYGQIKRDGSDDPGLTQKGFSTMHTFIGASYFSKDERYNKMSFDDMKSSPLHLEQKGGWIAMLQHYFMSAWIPDPQGTYTYSTVYQKQSGNYLMRFLAPMTTVAPGAEKVLSAELYAGPKIQDVLQPISPGLDRTVDYGYLWFIAQPIFAVMVFLESGQFHGFGLNIDLGFGVGNWGVAIILLTLIIKLLFFKLSATSYRSMAKMRKVAPEMQRIKEKFKGDKQKQQQETMKLFQREKINPLGGCLPMLVQMPVFIALYSVLLESVELRQAPFIFWIHDLSVMDPYFVLPILMGAAMFFQMRLNPTPADAMQAKVMKYMPLGFTVFMLWFPAGLTLYWLTNNLLSMAQQWIIYRKIERE